MGSTLPLVEGKGIGSGGGRSKAVMQSHQKPQALVSLVKGPLGISETGLALQSSLEWGRRVGLYTPAVTSHGMWVAL